MATTDRPVAVITGANRGIGLEVARQLAERDYQVIAGSRDPAKGREAIDRLGAGDRIAVAALDVSDPTSVEAAAAWVADTYGRADVLVNNAAILYDTWQRAVSADLAVVRQALETNLLGAWQVTQAFLPLLRRSGHGRIVNVSSESGSIAGMSGGTPAYSVSKAGLNALTCLLAGELGRDGILVNAVCPGWTATDMGGGGRPIPEGAASVTWAAVLPDDGPTGGFFRDGKPRPW